jgi:hypothetical protein
MGMGTRFDELMTEVPLVMSIAGAIVAVGVVVSLCIWPPAQATVEEPCATWGDLERSLDPVHRGLDQVVRQVEEVKQACASKDARGVQ